MLLTTIMAKDPLAEIKLKRILKSTSRDGTYLERRPSTRPNENKKREWEIELRQKCGNICKQFPKVTLLLNKSSWHDV